MNTSSMSFLAALALAVLVGYVSAGGYGNAGYNYGNAGYNYYGGMQSMYPGYAQAFQPLMVQQPGLLPAGGLGGVAYGGGLGTNQLFYYIILLVVVWWFIQSRDDN